MEALDRARSSGLDLVEVSPNSRPPVCKLMDFGKYKYQQKRKAAEAKRKQHTVELKEVKFRPKTDIHDFEVKINRLKSFLLNGNRVKVTIMFRGREIVHTEIGRDILKKILERFKDEATPESVPKMEGKQMAMILVSIKTSGKR